MLSRLTEDKLTAQFTETAPGVHTAALVHPRTGHQAEVAIIQSSDAYQIYVNGQLKSKDLPSFRAAADAVAGTVRAERSMSMVYVAGSLVLLSVVGATSIGMAKLMVWLTV